MSELAVIDGTYVEFRHYEAKEKTSVWIVNPKSLGDTSILGFIKWFPRWRKYAFFITRDVTRDCVFEETCLREIAQFAIDRTFEHKLKIEKERRRERNEQLPRFIYNPAVAQSA